MPYQLSAIQAALLDKRTLDLNGRIEGDMVMYVREALMMLTGLGSPEIEVRISSSGGNCHAGFDIYDLLRLYKGKKTGVVVCYSRSMAVIILQACDIRCCARHAKILIHHPSARDNREEPLNIDFLSTEKSVRKLVSDMRRDQNRIYQVLKRCGQTAKAIRRVCLKDEDMSAEEAKEFGLIDKII